MALRAVVGVLLWWAASVLPSWGADLVRVKDDSASADNALKMEIDVFVTSDYIYRGVSLSAHKPSVGSTIDVEWYGFYSSTNFQSVKLPTHPAAEITLNGGYRWYMWDFNFDLGANYFYYPGEIVPEGGVKTSYWEYALDVSRKVASFGELEGIVAYAPDLSNTGAWGAYAEGQATIELPHYRLLNDVDWRLIAGAGYWWFGNTSPAQGGFALPSHANWHVGLQFDLNDYLTLDVAYSDTSLSQENCFVFTGDLAGTPGGALNPISNPDGLRSRLCGAAVVGTLTAAFDPLKVKR